MTGVLRPLHGQRKSFDVVFHDGRTRSTRFVLVGLLFAFAHLAQEVLSSRNSCSMHCYFFCTDTYSCTICRSCSTRSLPMLSCFCTVFVCYFASLILDAGL